VFLPRLQIIIGDFGAWRKHKYQAAGRHTTGQHVVNPYGALVSSCSGTRGRASAEAALAEKKIAILERALQHHPGSETLLLELLRLVRPAAAGSELRQSICRAAPVRPPDITHHKHAAHESCTATSELPACPSQSG
jgi:hypothetical protein